MLADVRAQNGHLYDDGEQLVVRQRHTVSEMRANMVSRSPKDDEDAFISKMLYRAGGT